jgi:hypothetical protein
MSILLKYTIAQLSAPLVSALRWRRIDLGRRQGLPYRLRPELGEDRPRRADAARERVAVALNEIVKLLGESGGFFIGKVKVHGPRYGVKSAGREGSGPRQKRGARSTLIRRAQVREIAINVTTGSGAMTTVKDLLVRRGEEILRAPPAPVVFSGNPVADALVNDLGHYPHAFVLACVMDRQVRAELAWLIPHRFAEKLGGFDFPILGALSLGDVRELMTKPAPLHRFTEQTWPAEERADFYLGHLTA